MTNYVDAYGHIFRSSVKIKFKRCCCVDQRGKKKVCVPPDDEFMCERQAVLIKMELVTAEARREKDIEFQKKKALEEAINNAKEAAMKFLDSDEGKFVMEKKAYDAAQEDCENRLREAYLKKNNGLDDIHK